MQMAQTQGAIRFRRHYQRRRSGRCVLAIEVDSVALADVLIANGFLSFMAADDRAAVAKALERAVEVWITAAEGNR
jgi:hypothetical protein